MFRQQSNILLLTFTAISLLVACQAGGDFTGREYMPDMAHSQAYEIYVPSRTVTVDGEEIELGKKGMSARKPVAGTVPRGYVPYYYPDTNEGYEQAGKELRNPYNGKQFNAVLAEGKAAYEVQCAICHGSNGKGKGTLVANGVYPTPRSYFDDDRLGLSEGKMFHAVHYGKNLMGSYAAQLSKEDRWKVIAYIKDMQAEEVAKKKEISKAQALSMITGANTYNSGANEAATTEGGATTNAGTGTGAATVTATVTATATVTTTTTTIQEGTDEAKAGQEGNPTQNNGGGEEQPQDGEHKDPQDQKEQDQKEAEQNDGEGHSDTHSPDDAQTIAAADTDAGKKNADEKVSEKSKSDAEAAKAEELAKLAAEQKTVEEKAKAEAAKKASEEKAEAEKKAAEEKAKAEAAKKASEEKAKADAAKKAKEKSALDDKKELKKGEKIELNNVFFETSSAKLTQTSYAELNKLVSLLKKNPNTKVEIGGHTDNRGKKGVNDYWSKERAKAVYNYVVSKGINKSQLTYKGYGSSKPVATNNTDAGRAKNRRVELNVLK